MPEELATPPPSPSPEPSPAPAATGIAGLMDQLDRAAASPAPPAAAAAPKPAEPAKPATPAPAAAKVEPKPADAKPPEPKDEGEPDWSKAPPKWHKIYEGHKAKTQTEIQSLQAKIKALESKPFEQAGDSQKLQAYEKQLDELRNESKTYKQKLAELDYTKSDDYQTNYVQRAQTIYQEATQFVEQLKVTDGDVERNATKADFDYIRSLPLAARRKAATSLFGEYAGDVIDYTKSIDRIKNDAKLALQKHSENFERTAIERESMTKKQREIYESKREAALNQMRENEAYGRFFKEDEADPEASKLLTEGFALIDDISSKMDSLPVEDQAAYGAVFRARAAAFPRLLYEHNKVMAERDAMREELAKIRGTDPGAGQLKTGEKVDPPQPKGIDGMAAVFDQMPRS